MSLLKVRAALETALAALPNVIASVVIDSTTAGSPAVFVTQTPHLLQSGQIVTIHDHPVTALNGEFMLVVLGPSSFSLTQLVTGSPIASATGGIGGVLSANLTAWEGVTFARLIGVPFQRVNFVYGTPENPSFGGQHYREIGYMQVTLYYPVANGTFDVMTRAELIRSAFPRGSTFSFDGVTVNISGKPTVVQGMPNGQDYAVPIKIPYWADIFTN